MRGDALHDVEEVLPVHDFGEVIVADEFLQEDFPFVRDDAVVIVADGIFDHEVLQFHRLLRELGCEKVDQEGDQGADGQQSEENGDAFVAHSQFFLDEIDDGVNQVGQEPCETERDEYWTQISD